LIALAFQFARFSWGSVSLSTASIDLDLSMLDGISISMLIVTRPNEIAADFSDPDNVTLAVVQRDSIAECEEDAKAGEDGVVKIEFILEMILLTLRFVL
jgi:hypothetical protein